MKRYERKFNEAGDSIPKLEQLFKKYKCNEIFNSFVEYLKDSKQSKDLDQKLWDSIIDVMYGLEDYESSKIINED
jgi:hypothetical protein